MTEKFPLDDIDRKIISYLKVNSKTKLTTLSKKLNIPVSTIHTRIKKLEKEGIIKKYTIEIDYKKIGYEIQTFILIKYDANSIKTQRDLLKELLRLPNVDKGYIITGEWDILLMCRFQTIDDLSRFILDRLRNIGGVKETYTLVVLQEE